MAVELNRRAQLVDATISEIGSTGTLSVTVSQIARRAGVSPALAFHYFGEKDQLFLAAMRHILTTYGNEVRDALAPSNSHYERLQGIVQASFSPMNFSKEVVSAWLNFYVLSQRSDEAKRLLFVYHRRLHSNLLYSLTPLIGARASEVAQRIGGLIDGLYLRCATNSQDMTGEEASSHVLAIINRELGINE